MLAVVHIEPEAIRPLRRAEYDRMVALGFFADEHVELLDGRIVQMSPHGPAHDSTVQRITRILSRIVGERRDVRIQCAFAASDGSQPEPDAAVVAAADYDEAHPREAVLVIEVADSSLDRDRGAKATIYATSGVPEYWIVNLPDACIEVCTEPRAGVYTTRRILRRGEHIESAALEGVAIAVDAILR